MTKLNNNHGRRSERGIALFIAIFTLLLITAIAAGLLMLTNTDANISANFRDEQIAFFGAKGGLEEVRDRLRSQAAGSLTTVTVAGVTTALNLVPGFSNPNLAPPKPGQSGGVLYITNPLNGETVAPWNIDTSTTYPDTEICVEMVAINNPGSGCGANPTRPLPSSTWYNTASATSTYASNPVSAWKWVRLNVKTNQTSSGTAAASTVDGNTSDYNQLVCWNGSTQLAIASTYVSCAAAGAALVPAQNYTPVYVLTSLAVTPSGSRRMVQMDVATDVLPNIPGAMVMDGTSPVFGPGSSNAFSATGMDTSSVTNTLRPQNGTVCPPPGNEPAVGAYGAAASTTITNTFSGGGPNRSGNYTGAPTNVSNVSTALNAGGMNTVQGLTQLVNTITAGALPVNTYTNASALTNPGIPSAPVINVVTGDLTLGGSFTGSGILLVEGTLTFTGNPNYNGVILVVGHGVVNWSGGGNGTIDGAMLVANLYDSSNQPIASGAPGAPSINFSGSGNMTIQYDSCWVAAMNQMAPYKSLGVREMMY